MNFNGKAIYSPKGAAAEYSPWACNFYTGCSNDCEYCYCKRGVLSHVWGTEPKLKKCFKDEEHALNIFEREVIINKIQLQRKGLLFSFTTDPMIPSKTFGTTLEAMMIAVVTHHVPVKILTKRADWLDRDTWKRTIDVWKRHANLIAFGFTLTGFDEKEPGASLTDERIEAMRELHDMGFKTFASIEPVITPAMSRNMIEATRGFCDLYKVGLISGKGKNFYNRDHVVKLFEWLVKEASNCRIYLKDSFLDYLRISREDLPSHFVTSSYNIFTEK